MKCDLPIARDGFEWRCASSGICKAVENARKHGVSFVEAATTFEDPASITIDYAVHSEAEDRFVILGLSSRRRALVTIFTERAGRTLVISSRQATSNEREQHEQEFRES